MEAGSLAEMRHLSTVTVEATFDRDVPDLSRVAGVSSVQVDRNVVRLQVRGSIEPLLEAMAGSNVSRLLSREPSLEELFLTLYGEHNDAASTARTD